MALSQNPSRLFAPADAACGSVGFTLRATVTSLEFKPRRLKAYATSALLIGILSDD